MGSESAQADAADCKSLLPPRKRLLAGLKKQDADCSKPASKDLMRRFRCLLNSEDLAPEEIIERLRSAAVSAAKDAAAARAIATEKAAAAANAKEFARSVLELVSDLSADEHRRKTCRRRKTLRQTRTENLDAKIGSIVSTFSGDLQD